MRRNIGATEIRLPQGSLEFPACAAIAHQGDTKIPPLIHKGKIIFIWRNAKSAVCRLERFELSNLGCGFRLGHFFTLRRLRHLPPRPSMPRLSLTFLSPPRHACHSPPRLAKPFPSPPLHACPASPSLSTPRLACLAAPCLSFPFLSTPCLPRLACPDLTRPFHAAPAMPSTPCRSRPSLPCRSFRRHTLPHRPRLQSLPYQTHPVHAITNHACLAPPVPTLPIPAMPATPSLAKYATSR